MHLSSWHNHHLASAQCYGVLILILHDHLALKDEEEIIRIAVFVKGVFPLEALLEFDDHDLVVIVIGNDFGIPQILIKGVLNNASLSARLMAFM